MSLMTRFLVVLALLLCSVSCAPELDDEAALRDTIDAMQQLVEARESSELLSYFAEDFIGNPGRYDKDRFSQLVRGAIMLNQRITVTITSVEVELIEDRATVHCNVLLTGSGGRMLPERGRLYAVKSGWRLGDDGWQLIQANWGG